MLTAKPNVDLAKVIDLRKHMKISLENVATRVHNTGVRNSDIPFLTGATQESVEVHVLDWDKVEVTYNTDYAPSIWEYNSSGEIHWTIHTWNYSKNMIIKQLIKDMMSKTIPHKEDINY